MMFRRGDPVDDNMPHNNSRYFVICLASDADKNSLDVAVMRQKQIVSEHPVACFASGVAAIVMVGTMGLAVGCTLSGLYSAFIKVEQRVSGGKLIRQHISPIVRAAMVRFVCRELHISENIPNFEGIITRLGRDRTFKRKALKALAKFYRVELDLKVLPPW